MGWTNEGRSLTLSFPEATRLLSVPQERGQPYRPLVSQRLESHHGGICIQEAAEKSSGQVSVDKLFKDPRLATEDTIWKTNTSDSNMQQMCDEGCRRFLRIRLHIHARGLDILFLSSSTIERQSDQVHRYHNPGVPCEKDVL